MLEPIWWKMRDIIFEPKPPPKSRKGVRRPNTPTIDHETAYEADNDTELDIGARTFERARLQTLDKIDENRFASTPLSSVLRERRYMTAEETDEAIIKLVELLADTRANSKPDVFGRLWDQHLARLDELETAPSPTTALQGVVSAASTTAVATDLPLSANLSNEPFAAHGNPIPQQFPRPLPPRVPGTMSVFITTSPPESPYTNQAYHWLDAPVGLAEQIRFFERLLLRVKIPDCDVQGYAFSYGWSDVARWVVKGDEWDGWGVLQADIARGADLGVGIWRMKVLVVRG